MATTLPICSNSHSETLIKKTLHDLGKSAATEDGKNLFDANKAVYGKLRYGVKVKEEAGQQNKTIWLVDWSNPEKIILP